MIPRRIDRYVFKIFVVSLSAAAVFVAGMLVLADQYQHFDNLIQAPRKLRELGHRDLARAVVPMALQYYAYEIAIRFFQYTPFVTFFAAVFTASRVHRSQETVAILASGTSLQRGMAPVFFGAFLIAILQLTFREMALPELASRQAVLRSVLLELNPDYEVKNLSVLDDASNRFVFDAYRPVTRSGTGFSAYYSDHNKFMNITAREARFSSEEDGGVLQLIDGRVFEVPREGAKRAEPVPVSVLPADFVITARDCEVAARAGGDPDHLSISELESFARRQPNSRKYQVALHLAFTFAIANLLLPLLGLPCVLRQDRKSPLEGAVFAFVLCIIYFAATLLCFQLGKDDVIGTVFAAWLPTVVFGSLGIVMFESMRT